MWGIFKSSGTIAQNVGYRSYVALLTQTATDAPTAVVLYNDLGGDITYSYGGNGTYSVVSSGLFTDNKTFFLLDNENFNINALCTCGWADANTLTIMTVDPTTGTKTNAYLRKTPFEIRVYS